MVLVLAALNLATLFLSPELRLICVMVGSIPALMFVFAHAAYESQVGVTCLRGRFVLMSVLTLELLLLPMALLVVRHSMVPVEHINLAKAFSLATLATFALEPLIPDEGAYPTLRAIAGHMKLIMWDVWKYPPHPSPHSIHVDMERIQTVRASTYVDKAALAAFQSTLSCQVVDSKAITEHLPQAWIRANEQKSISVLDIGGGEGLFTANLLSELKSRGITIGELKVIDAVDWGTEYRATMTKLDIVSSSRISHHLQRIEDSPIDTQYDLVIASHSLYAPLDKCKNHAENKRAIVDHILGWRNANGLALVTMASRAGRSYAFKATALELTFGVPITDIAAEDLVVPLRCNPVARVDNLIDLTALIAEFETGDAARLHRWLTYFLRLPLDNYANMRDYLPLLLREYVVPFRSLSETDIHRYRAMLDGPILDNLVLTHKVWVWILEASASQMHPYRQSGSDLVGRHSG